MTKRGQAHEVRCGDCGRAQGHESGCYAGGGDPEAIRDLLRGPLGKRCEILGGPEGRRITIDLTEDEWQAAQRAHQGA